MAGLRLLCVAAACHACLGIRRWSPFRAPKPYVEPPPAFYACNGVGAEVAGGCPRATPSPSRTMESLLKYGYGRMQEISHNGREPSVVFVGAGALQSGERWSDSYFLKKIAAECNVSRQNIRAAFVDPLEQGEEFGPKIYQTHLNSSSVSHVRAVLDPRCAGQTRLYRFSPQAASEFGLGRSVAKLFSVRPEQPAAIARTWASGNATCQPLPECKEGAEKMGKEANLTKFVEEVPVPCMSPLDMVRDTGNMLHNIGMMIIDTEGMSLQGLFQMMMHSDFVPGFLMWKSLGAPEELELRKHLHKRGYEVGIKPVGNDTAHGYGIAVRTPEEWYGHR